MTTMFGSFKVRSRTFELKRTAQNCARHNSSDNPREKEKRKMVSNKRIPEYYPTMYLDGYTPEEILQSKRKSMLKKGSDEDAKVVLSKNQEQELEK